MSNENLWGDEDIFNDMPEESNLGYTEPPFVAEPPQSPVVKKMMTEDLSKDNYSAEEAEVLVDQDEDEEDYSQVLSDASLRLEQGNLYKLIMNHDLFSDVDADPRAVKAVQKQIKRWAKEQMEVMLGMRKETSKIERLEINFPFNTMEVEVLKKLAFTATKGASENSDNYVPEVKKVTEEIPIVKKKLNTITDNRVKKEMSKISTTQQKNTLKNKSSNPIKRSKLDLTIEQIVKEENIPRELLEENLLEIGGKPVGEMTEQEILERNRIISKRRQPRVKSSKALPMASYEQQEMLASTQAGQFQSDPLMNKILEVVKNMPVKN